jgi:hypothetical protein
MNGLSLRPGRPYLSVMSVPNASTRIRAAVAKWPGMNEAPHRFGGVEFRLGAREIGHLHGDVLLDVPFPKRVRNELVDAGLARPHHVLPESGWVSFFIEDDADVDAAVALLRRSHDLVAAQLERRRVQSEAVKGARRS